MKVYKLFQLGVSTAEKGLWWDHDEREYCPDGWGIVFKLFSGPVVRPMTKPRFWFAKSPVPSKWNEFDPDYHWLLKWWMPLAPFLSVALGRYGFYIGFKVFDLESAKYRQMAGVDEVYPGSQALTPSITTRTTRWK